MESPFPAFLGLRPDQLGRFGHFPTDLVFEDFAQRDVRRAKVVRVGHERTAQAAAAGIELAHPARDEVDKDVWIADLFGGFLA